MAATRTAAARAAAPSPTRSPAPSTAGRPRLRVVDDRRLKLERRQRRVRVVAALGISIAAGLFFLVAACHAFLVGAQSRLDRLEAEVAEAQATYSARRLEVDQLEAPGRVVNEAKRLGMQQPSQVTYLSPSSDQARAVGAVGTSRSGGDDRSRPSSGRSLAAVKRELAAHP